jgi:Flp pilus assembly protein TadG
VNEHGLNEHRLNEHGSATVELVLVTPVLIVLLLFVVAAGRFATARNRVDEAARDAAREASIWATPVAATSNGIARGLASLDGGGITCRRPMVTIDTSQLRPGGEVIADVTCQVELGDVIGLRVGGWRTFQARAVAVVDTFRSG